MRKVKLFTIFFLFILGGFLFLMKIPVLAYKCGSEPDDLYYCATGGTAESAIYCDYATEIQVPDPGEHYCCPSDTKGIYVGGDRGKCCYKELRVANGTFFLEGLCCPPEWIPDSEGVRSCYKQGGQPDERCDDQAECDRKAKDINYVNPIWSHDSLVQQDARPAPFRKMCPREDQCFYFFPSEGRGIDDKLCFNPNSVLLNQPFTFPSEIYVGNVICRESAVGSGNWGWYKVPDTCGDGKCITGTEDDSTLSTYCPHDCGVTTPTSTFDPIYQLSCHNLCLGEGEDVDGKWDTMGDFSEGPQYASCCRCLCGSDTCTNDPALTATLLTSNVWTELGCINATEEGVVIAVMRVFVGVVAGLAVIRFIQAGIMLNTDDPEQIKEGKSIAISAVAAIIVGTMMPILLNFIGLDILGIGTIFKLS